MGAGGSEMRKLETCSGSIGVSRVAGESPHGLESDHQVLKDHEFGSSVMWSPRRLLSSEVEKKKKSCALLNPFSLSSPKSFDMQVSLEKEKIGNVYSFPESKGS